MQTNVSHISPTATHQAHASVADAKLKQGADLTAADKKTKDTREAFDAFVGQTFYGQMLKSLRKSVGKAPYFDGGRTEEIFRGQLDQTLSEKMSKSSAGKFTGPMFDHFSLQVSQLRRQ
jgi:Rod binding domain-containing protein